MYESTRTIFIYVIILLGIGMLVRIISRKTEDYKNIVDYRIDSTLRNIQNSVGIEHFASHQPKGITNTSVMGHFYEKYSLPDWNNFNLIKYVFHSSPVPDHLPQNVILQENENVDAYGDKREHSKTNTGCTFESKKVNYGTSNYML